MLYEIMKQQGYEQGVKFGEAELNYSNQKEDLQMDQSHITVEKLLEGYTKMEGLNQDIPRILAIEDFTIPTPQVQVSGWIGAVAASKGAAAPTPYVRVSCCFGDGSDPQFNIYFPPKEQWKGRFFQRAHPFLGIDAISEDLEFYFENGGYTITVPQNIIGHVVHASAAHVSRTIAKNYYGYNEKIYGYLYGGSGGSMQTIGALELSTGLVWDGAVPFIVAEPASLANFDIRWFARAVLEEKGPLIADAVRPGGSGDPYAVLNDMERDILREVTKLGLPLQAWENYEYVFLMHANTELVDGLNAIGELNESYTNAFWNEPGYLEAYAPKLRDLFYSLRDRGVSEGSLAKMAYHRHKDPGPSFYTWNHLRDSDGAPLYAQTTGIHYAIESSKMVSGGATWNGKINYKTIMVVNLMDIDAFPSDGDYYRERVKAIGRSGDFRFWLNENADHHGAHDAYFPYLNSRLIDYTGILEQALLDLSAWVEDGVEPPDSTNYKVVDSQLIVEENAAVRGGIQPVVTLTANGTVRAGITSGSTVDLSARIQVPQGIGKIVSVEWDFLGNGDFIAADFEALPDGSWSADTSYTYQDEGTYIPQVRVVSQRDGNADTPFTRVYNLGRARVVVGE